MLDYFAVLQVPRRPWLEPQKLKARYCELAFRKPDNHQGGEKVDSPSSPPVVDLPRINEAFCVLLDPKQRLQHLLKLEGMPMAKIVPETLSDVFLETGTLTQEVDRLLAKATVTHVNKAMLQPEIIEKQQGLDDLIGKLEAMQSKAIEELRALDELWMSTHRIEHKLSDLAARFAYLSRWLATLQDRKFQLSIL